jgi:aminobenzoyl-glutamate utilization protein B
VESSGLLQEKLLSEGFSIDAGVAEMPTAFVASFGSGKPVTGILAEFDALPGVSQEAVPYRKERDDNASGHACGHHLFGTGSSAAAIAVKNWLKKTGTKGTIRVYGTPAEEGGSGKVYMVRAGLFDDADLVLSWHPGSQNGVGVASNLAIKSARFRFYGIASHAAGFPERGRSALDGVEAMNYMVNMMREHVPAESRIHYVITKGGEAPNVVPAFAEVYYYVRHPDMRAVKSIFERMVKAAEGAALGTGTTMDYEIAGGSFNLLPNEVLARQMHANLTKVGGVYYNVDERNFAEKIMTTYDARGAIPEDASSVEEFVVSEVAGNYSTDSGDVSWVVPHVSMRAATWPPGTASHSWQAVASGGTGIGVKGMLVASKTIALTAMDIFNNPEIAAKAQEELFRRRGEGFIYESMIGDRTPPLDYRKN